MVTATKLKMKQVEMKQTSLAATTIKKKKPKTKHEEAAAFCSIIWHNAHSGVMR